MAKIGVFDSGIGGLSVARALEAGLPDDEVIFVNDHTHMPYGNKSPRELLHLVQPLLEALVGRGCEIIVIACNTVSTTILPELRKRLPVPLVGIEPMVKPAAALTESGVIAVCATPTTLASSRYAELKQTHAANIKVLEPDCSQWAAMIERDEVNEAAIKAAIAAVCDRRADVIVLGCTHYHWIEDVINQVAKGQATVIQPEQAIVRQVKRVLGRTAD